MFGFKTSSSARTNTRNRRFSNAQSSAEHAGWRGLTVTFSPGGVVASVIGFVVVLVWVFFVGIFVGRGGDPEKGIPGASMLLSGAVEEEPRDEILKPEELTFLSDLKQKANGKRPAGAPPATTPSAPEASQATPAATGNAQAPTPPSPHPEPPVPAPDAMPVYNYVFRVASYRSSEPAELLRERLEEAGLRTRLVRERQSGKRAWYRVQVLLRGTEERAEAAKNNLVQTGINDAMLISRKPVSK